MVSLRTRCGRGLARNGGEHDAALRRRICGNAAQINSLRREILDFPEGRAHIPDQVALHKMGVMQMIALIEKFLDAMFAPLTRELERLPASALRFNVFF